jgi:hypothetical protein
MAQGGAAAPYPSVLLAEDRHPLKADGIEFGKK